MIGTFSLDQQARAHFISRAPHLISTTCPFLSLVYNHRCGDVEIFSPWEETWKDRLEYLDQIDNSLSFRNEIRHEGVHLRRSDTRPSSLPSWIWHCSTGITGSEALVHGVVKARVQILKQRGESATSTSQGVRNLTSDMCDASTRRRRLSKWCASIFKHLG